ncbi:hypothetical protein [Sphingomonas gilva]|uniref:hypothetical protein n=1 Tax=Sphingomonas gilva TaxID=2305907 RepID=UPI0011C455C5|nr:hypothetical protein [Sphingomonas gilva]
MQGDTGSALRWWQTRLGVTLIALLSAIPLLWPDVPPLVDLPGHMARYRVQLDGGATPWFDDWYHFDWSLIGNLGVDLLIVPMAWLFGLELGVKLIILAIPPLTSLGLLWIAREVHGRVPPTAFWALPLAYCFPFHFGFANFSLSMAFALLAFALWLRLGRTGHVRLRVVVFVPISVVVWITHTFGWGVLGVLAFSAELFRQHDKGHNFAVAWVRAGVACLVLALPLALMVIWRSGSHVGGQTADWFNWDAKYSWMTMVLRDRWKLFDIASFVSLLAVLVIGLRNPAIEYSRNLAMSALFLLAVYVLLPRIVFGSAYADMRLAPFVIAIALIALRPRPKLTPRMANLFLAASLAFFAVRTAGTTISFWLYDRDYDRELAALDHVPIGARLVSFTSGSCFVVWKMHRLEHLPGLALIRRGAYTNDQWSMAGAQLLTVTYRGGGPFTHDPSQITTARQCRTEFWRPLNKSLQTFPRDGFDYVWLISPPPYDPANLAGLTPVWRDGRSMVLRVDR